MQVISCAENESIEIGEHLTVQVVEIHDDHVRIGITSTDESPSYREEILYLETNEAELLHT